MGLLRVLLAVSVFMAHAPQSGLTFGLVGFGGVNAVEIFFVVSGFYIALILDKSYSTNLSFYKNRVLRLYPIYYIICALVLLQSFIMSNTRTSSIFPNTSSSYFTYPQEIVTVASVANSTFFGSDWMMFLQWHNNSFRFGTFDNSEIPLWHMLLVPQIWSIGIEVTFYLLAPMLCKAKSSTIIGLGTTLLVARISGLFLGLNQDPWTYRFFPFELPLFLFGILLYRARTKYSNIFNISKVKVYSFLIIIYIAFPFSMEKLHINRIGQMLILVFLTAVVIFNSQQDLQDKKFGELSYPIYMSHILVINSYSGLIQFMSRKDITFEKLNAPLVAIPLTLIITLILSFALLQLVKPIEKIRDKNRK